MALHLTFAMEEFKMGTTHASSLVCAGVCLVLPAAAQGFTVNPGGILISNHSGNNVQRLEPDSGTVTTLTTVPGTPIGLAFDPDGNLYINVSTSIMKLDKTTGMLSTHFVGNGQREGLAFDPRTGHLFSVSYGANLIEEVDLDGNLIRTITVPTSTALISVAARRADLIVSDFGTGQVFLGSTTGTTFTAIGALTPGNTYAVDEDASGNIYANDFATGKTIKFAPSGGGTYARSDFITGLGCPANGLSIGDDDSLTLSEFCSNEISVWNSDGSLRSVFPGVQSPDELVVYAPARTCGTPAAFSNYGAGGSGTLGVPSLTLDAAPILGTTVNILMGNSAGSSTHGCLIVGAAPAATPTPFSFNLLIAAPMQVIPLMLASGTTPLTVSIGASISNCGQHYYMQLVMSDPGAQGAVSSTPGLDLVLGN